MTIKNHIYNKTDLQYSKDTRDKNNWEHDFPHQDLWRKDDALVKWVGVLDRFKELYPENGVTVVDLGCARGCVSHIIDSWGNEVTGVDCTETGGRLDHDCKGSNVTMVNSNIWDWFPTVENESIDVFTDLCSITHFCGRSGVCSDGKHVLDNVFRETYRCLKPGGHFIISSDCQTDSETGEFVSPETFISSAKEQGFSLVGRWSNRTKDLFKVPGFPHLNVVSLTFKKNV
jgi:SAM-dependent methyltransferase